MKTNQGVAMSDAEWQIVSDILDRIVPTHQAWVFGSRATHRHKPFSDLDIALCGSQALDLQTQSALTEAFAESDLPYKVDWVDWLTITPEFRSIIDAQRKLVRSPRP